MIEWLMEPIPRYWEVITVAGCILGSWIGSNTR